jgi:MFS family permease
MMVLIDEIVVFYIVIGVIGIFENIAGPARQAMIADLVPEELRGEAYGIFRIIFNLAVTIAPAIGGFMVTRSFETLFYADVAISIAVALFVLFFMPETKPETIKESKKEQSLAQTFQGYRIILKDKLYIIFIAVSALSTLMYFNMHSSMSVYLIKYRGITPAQFGYILSLNAGMVVILQLLFTRITAKWKPLLAIAFGNLLYVIGFTMYGIFNTYLMFVIAMIIITIGEMIYAPKEQMIVANIAPEHMRGRYMAIRNFAWIIPVAIGPLGAGMIMDNFDPRYVWFAAGFVGSLSVIGFLFLHFKARERFEGLGNGKTENGKKDRIKKDISLEADSTALSYE